LLHGVNITNETTAARGDCGCCLSLSGVKKSQGILGNVNVVKLNI